MDLTFDETQQDLIDLADRILGDTCPPERLREAERSGRAPWHPEAWAALADAGLLGVGLPESVGGAGFGLCESALVVQAVARSAAALPAFATLICAAEPIARFGSDTQQARWLPGVIDGSSILTGVLVGDGEGPAYRQLETPDGIRVSGTGWYVAFAAQADAFVAPVQMLDGTVALAVIDADTPGIVLTDLSPMSGEPSSMVQLDLVDVPDDAWLGGPADDGDDGIDRVGWLEDRALAATCVAQVGTCEGALALTASYVSSREQFGAKLATFQAVAQRAADAWIDTELVRLTAWSAMWNLASGRRADQELAVAKYFAAEAAQRVVAAAQHLHGGIGMDLDYPVHRYFRWAKEHELRLGGGAEHLARLGALVADPSR